MRPSKAGVFFATRLKDNAVFEIVEERAVPQNRNILNDQIIRLTGTGAAEKCPHLLRRVVVRDAEHEREIVLLTNHTDFGTTTIAYTYKQRWQIEICFKTIKQNLKIKTFVGVSENALRIQIWTALIALPLLHFLHHLSKARWSLSNLTALLRLNLFTYRDLQQWIDEPFNMPPIGAGRRCRAGIPPRFWTGGLSRAGEPVSASGASASQFPENYARVVAKPVQFWAAVFDNTIISTGYNEYTLKRYWMSRYVVTIEPEVALK